MQATKEREERGSFWDRVLSSLNRGSVALLPFEEVRERLKLYPSIYRGLREIPLDRIIGSVGRYRDFDRAFLPRRVDDRWKRINKAWQQGEKLPPIEAYQVGDVYFVADGNHRVSAARANGASHIDAYITEFPSPVPIEPDTDLDDLIVKQEQLEFQERTRLQELRPGANVTLTAPGGYRQLLEHIEVHRYFMEEERGRPVPWEEAVMHWYDEVYCPIVEAIREHKLLERFPGRTETDLYLWISQHQWELRERYGTYAVDADLAAVDFAAQHGRKPLRRVRRIARDALATIGGMVEQLTMPPTTLPIVVPMRIAQVNTLPSTWRRKIYRLVLPNELLVRYGLDPVALVDKDERPAVFFDDSSHPQSAAICVVVPGFDDPLLSLGLADDPQGRLHLTHLISYRLEAPRFDVDRDKRGKPLRAGRRNLDAETAAMEAGLAPGQVRAPTGAHATVLAQLDVFAAALYHPLFVARPLYYHEAIFLERHGFAYSWGEDWMKSVDSRFRDGDLAERLDGSTPFRRPEAALTVRGRSWAIHDGLLDEPWPTLWMSKAVGAHAGVDTFPGGPW